MWWAVSVLVITGTGTDVGKTVVVAALAAIAAAEGRRVAVLKPVQTGVLPGEPGDLAEVQRMAGPVTTRELRRYPDPLSPAAAARRSGLPTAHPAEIAGAATELDDTHDLVLLEGAGGLLVPLDDRGATLADAAWALHAPVLVVAHAALGTLNTTALTAEVLVRRGLESIGVVIGRWPEHPDLAARSNLTDLPEVAGAPLLGVLPDGAGALSGSEFLEVARAGLSPWFGGTFDPDKFSAPHTC
ncbi:dethiobiotin synthase [Actinosynnema mirum DSM 43827]|uniref:ATP-dependent dethiobiotin synthetase BioD n=1 Tax=Actinosynnema mirum (strain ATCC 29888 / DSM 43827 / JCM 3225 / NBRC 14064 / NCIMB 13271 / NRRL B-12336 / IMRU 3971 / 101) TaxID=446462 RepID=C6WDB6_ACTMD|nr:dethiobiotin synthase [Actinosynnema mirum DSM 43827]